MRRGAPPVGRSRKRMETGYEMMGRARAEALHLRAGRVDGEPETTAKLLEGGYRISEVEVGYAPRGARKLSPWRDGPHALWTLLRLRWQS